MTADSDGRTVDILLATYNGAAYLAEQLDSIRAQTHAHWRLIARDDGSSDATPEILAAFQNLHPNKVTIIYDHGGNLGLVGNFSRLMEHSTAPYAAFCDQDDVWLPEKLALCVGKMSRMEHDHGAQTPLLVFSDLIVMDSAQNIIDPSFWSHQGLAPETSGQLSRLTLLNVVTGCTIMMNKRLRQLATPIPHGAHAHDWWVALVAAAFGRTAYVERPLVCYRQHPSSTFGARPVPVSAMTRRAALFLADYSERKRYFSEVFRQAEAFRRHYKECLTEIQKAQLDAFLRIRTSAGLSRILHARRARCMPAGLLRKLAFLVAA